jgi:hypothetical protein
MRWFTDEAFANDETDWDDVLGSYSAYLAEVGPRLPTALMALATDPRFDLRDGRFRDFRIDRNATSIEMAIDCGNRQVGYRRLTLRFDQAAVIPDNLQLLAEAIGAEFRPNHWHKELSVTEIRAVEVDLLPPARSTLRLLLWPFHEFGIAFGGLAIDEDPLDGRGENQPGKFIVVE